MDRRAFSRATAASLLCAPTLLHSSPPAHVTVIGAGSAGLTAAYHLEKAGIDVQVLEAASGWGGRVKRLSGFSDVPLDLGAEWIHDAPTILGRIIGEGETDLSVQTIAYNPQTFQLWDNGRLKDFNLLRHAYEEVKFLDTTWYGFFERFVLPRIGEKVEFRAAAKHVSSSGAGVSVHLVDGRTLETDKVIVTVPLSVLQRGQVSFSYGLTPPHLAELQNIDFGSGFKVFMKFSERFYPDILLEGSRMSVLADTWSSKLYYDAVLGKPTRQNILGLFTVSDGALPRAGMDDQSLIDDVLSELTSIFGSVARRAYVDGVVQNWAQEPHIRGSYSMTNHSDLSINEILAPIDGCVFFAGEALGEDAQSTVQGAAFSAIHAVDELMAN
ncbi:MAG: NAD(P)/FAD-dependent oxidoreductase [Pseudomonadota bacterium]